MKKCYTLFLSTTANIAAAPQRELNGSPPTNRPLSAFATIPSHARATLYLSTPCAGPPFDLLLQVHRARVCLALYVNYRIRYLPRRDLARSLLPDRSGQRTTICVLPGGVRNGSSYMTRISARAVLTSVATSTQRIEDA